MALDGHKPYKTWQSAFETDDRATAAAAVNPVTDTLEWRESDKSLSLSSIRPAFHQLTSGEEVMMNHLYTLHASLIDHRTEIYRSYKGLPNDDQPFHTRWGDGEEFRYTRDASPPLPLVPPTRSLSN